MKWILGPHDNWGPAFQPYLLSRSVRRSSGNFTSTR